MAEKINPYIAGAPVIESSLFFGRDDVFSWVSHTLQGKYVDHILVIHGQRRVGKTSVLKQLSRRLPEHYIQVFLDLQGRTATSPDRFLWWLGREITKALRTQAIDLDTPDREAFSQDPDYFESTFIPDLNQALGEKKLLLTFDEFDTLDSPAAREGLAPPLLAILQRLMIQGKMAFIFSIGSSGRKLENMQAVYSDFFKQALYKKVSFLNEEDARALITQPVAGVLEYTPEAIQMIYQITSGHPYYIQLTCHELFSTCQKVDRWVVHPHHVEDVLDQVIERGTANLKYIWDEAPPLGKWILGLLAHANESQDEAGLAAALNREHVRFAPSDLASELLRLREKDLLTQDNGFVVQLMRLWMRRNRPIERVREELVEINPIANRLIEIGEEYLDQGDYALAAENFNKALAVDPANLRAMGNLGFTALKQQRYEQALGYFEKALALDEEDVLVRNGICQADLALGEAALSRGEIERAAVYYHQVLKLDSEHQEARQKLRTLDGALDNYAQAEQALKRKDYTQATRLLKEVIQVSESYKDASSLLAQAVAAQRKRSPARLNRRLVAGLIALAVVALAGWLVTINWDTLRNLASELPSLVRLTSPTPTTPAATNTAQPSPIYTEPEWVAGAALPLLDLIASQPPDLEEDFSAPDSAWTQFGPGLSISDGVLNYEGTGVELAPDEFKFVTDFVLQFDLISEGSDDLIDTGVAFRGNEAGYYNFFLTRIISRGQSLVGLEKLGSEADDRFYVGTAPYLTPGIPMQVMLMVKNNQIILFLNGKPITLEEDDTWGSGYMRIFLGSREETSPVQLKIDNLKYWKLEPEWVKDFVEPVLQSIEGQPPDFSEDFTDFSPGWDEALGNGALIEKGVLSYTGPEFGFTFDQLFLGHDFVLQYTLTPHTQDQFQYFNIEYRKFKDQSYVFAYDYGDAAAPSNQRWVIFKQQDNQQTELSSWRFDQFFFDQPNVITLIAQGGQFGVLINGAHVGPAQDDQYQAMSIRLGLGSLNSQAPIWVEIDDIKIWDLDPVEEKEFAKPILLAANNLPYTFVDTFDEANPAWEPLPEGVSIADGKMVMQASDRQAVSLVSDLFAAQDFYIRLLFTLEYSGEGAEVFYNFRSEVGGYHFSLIPHPGEPVSGWSLSKNAEPLENGVADYLPGQTNELICLAQGDQFAIYLNGVLLSLFRDEPYTGKQNEILLGMGPGNAALYIDELNFNDLSTMNIPYP